MQISGAEIIVKCLIEEGVDTVFGYPGGAIIPFYDKLREEARIKREAEGRAPGWIQESSSDEDDSDSDEDSSDDDQPKKAKPTKVIVGGKKTTEVSLGAVSKELAEKKREKALKSESGGGSGGGDDSLEKLSAIEIKKMNPNALKDALKARNLDIQGAKKDLLKRLLDHEAAK